MNSSPWFLASLKMRIMLFSWRKQSSGMWRRVDIVLTDVTEERIASFFRVEEKGSTWALAGAGSSLAEFLLFSSTLKMEAIRSSETSVNTMSTRGHIPENCFLHSRHRENLKSYLLFSCLAVTLRHVCVNGSKCTNSVFLWLRLLIYLYFLSFFSLFSFYVIILLLYLLGSLRLSPNFLT
jgi:hypothetical protein